MPDVRVSISLPYALLLEGGAFPTAPAGEEIGVGAGPLEEAGLRTILSASFPATEAADPDVIQSLRVVYADRLLRRSNRLLRWYRSIRKRADVNELTRAQASPFTFEMLDGPGNPIWTASLEYEANGPVPVELSVLELTRAVREGLATGGDPPVDLLFLLDAERAIHQGRFREAVLFCWSTIDSVFNRKYNRLATAATTGEWGEAREFLKGFDFGMRNKMTLGMKFVAGRSLFAEPGDFWNRLSASYKKRNKIIHEGDTSTEDEAVAALRVARQLVQIMEEIMEPAPAAALSVVEDANPQP